MATASTHVSLLVGESFIRQLAHMVYDREPYLWISPVGAVRLGELLVVVNFDVNDRLRWVWKDGRSQITQKITTIKNVHPLRKMHWQRCAEGEVMKRV